MTWDLSVKEETISTNEDVRARADQGAEGGLAICSFYQGGGHGQFDRVWVSPRGGLYFSVLLRPSSPASQWPAIPGMCAHLVRKALLGEWEAVAGRPFDPHSIWIKQPNDVVCREGKLCGISLDAVTDATGRQCIIVGTGINVFHPEDEIVTDGRNIPAFFCDFAALPQESWEERRAYLLHLLDVVLDAYEELLGL